MSEDQIIVVSPPSIDIVSYSSSTANFLVTNFPDFVEGVKTFISFAIGVSIPLSVIFFIGIFVAVERLKIIRKVEDEYYNPKVEVAYDDEGQVDKETEKKWRLVMEHMESQNPNDWRQAVMEADIMLSDLLTRLGYRGEGIGEQLKRVEKGDFATLNDAWEAHKVRNRLAHDGTAYAFSKHDALSVINMYKRVFEEFMYI